MQLCRLKQLFIVFEINFNAKHSHVCRLPAEEVVFRNASVSYSTLLLVFWNTKIGGNASATTFGVSEHHNFTRCSDTPLVSWNTWNLVFWNAKREAFRNTNFKVFQNTLVFWNARCGGRRVSTTFSVSEHPKVTVYDS